MPRNFHTAALIAFCIPAVSCRSSGDFRLRTLPDPVPIHVETGRAWFLVEVQSLSRQRVRVGLTGPELEPGGRLLLDADLPIGANSLQLDLVEIGTGRKTPLIVPVRMVQGVHLTDLDFPLPKLGIHQSRISAGFHAPNHRRPGRRLAVDLVPLLPHGESVFGTPVLAPFRAQVIAFTEEEPDLPGSQPNEILLRDEQGRIWRYAHFMQGSIPLTVDRWVAKGDLLGRIGMSGQTSGPHLHVELLRIPDSQPRAARPGSPAKEAGEPTSK